MYAEQKKKRLKIPVFVPRARNRDDELVREVARSLLLLCSVYLRLVRRGATVYCALCTCYL